MFLFECFKAINSPAVEEKRVGSAHEQSLQFRTNGSKLDCFTVAVTGKIFLSKFLLSLEISNYTREAGCWKKKWFYCFLIEVLKL